MLRDSDGEMLGSRPKDKTLRGRGCASLSLIITCINSLDKFLIILALKMCPIYHFKLIKREVSIYNTDRRFSNPLCANGCIKITEISPYC